MSAEALIFREATPDDIEAIRQVALQSWPETYGPILQPGQVAYMLNLGYSPASLQKQMAEGHRFLMAEDGDGVAGFASIGPTEEAGLWKLHKLYLMPRCKGSGYGGRLLRHAEATAHRAGADSMILQVNRANPAVGFYRKMGYHVDREMDLPIGKGFEMNDYIMRRTIAAS